VAPCDDPSNSNTDFDRVQFRNWLASAPSTLDARRTARTVAALSDAHTALEWAAAQIANDRLVRPSDGKVRLDPQGLPSELVRRLLILALQAVDPAIDPRGSTTDRALAALAAGETLTIGNILCRGGPIWHFQPAPERRQNH
ncbi:MAG: tRNA lysidine(34) synthetase TilS, partial [Pseudomonadota bacterium]